MSSSRRRWWGAFALAVVVALAGMGWVTSAILELERVQVHTRADAEQQARLRLALWRMDSAIAPILSREAGRSIEEYLLPSERLLGLQSLGPSPLQYFRSNLIPLHFQLRSFGGGLGTVSSPQVDQPLGTVDPEELDRRRDLLAGLRSSFDQKELERRFEIAREREAHWDALPEAELSGGRAVDQALLNQVELTQRNYVQQSYNAFSPSWIEPSPGSPEVSGFLGLWLEPQEPRLLACLRRVDEGTSQSFQGFLLDWERLQDVLREQVEDLFADVELRPLADDAALETDNQLATLPITAHVAPPEIAALRVSRSAYVTLWIAWLSAFGALTAVGLSLRASIAYARKRGRFASTVTHELRTPLTTFRMY